MTCLFLVTSQLAMENGEGFEGLKLSAEAYDPQYHVSPISLTFSTIMLQGRWL